ncbi:MAG: hypothetical protein VX498_06500, partial [Myxococcota bacterium]|nr:hypothetical protein [Myxococcota bacterium]
LAFSYFFSPSIVAADELSLLTPKGPDVEDACFVRANARGPLGSFRTVDVGENMLFTNNAEDPALRTEFIMGRNPQDYPVNTSTVFIYYVGTSPLRTDDPILPDNWPYGEDVEMHFEGALPPENAPVASIPLPSDAADEEAGKEAGHPVVFTPDELTGVQVSNRLDDQGLVPLRFEPTSSGLPDPRGNDGVLHVRWDEPTTEEADTHVTVSILLLAEGEGSKTINAVGVEDFCVPAEPMEVDGLRDDAWFIEYNARKGNWCDSDYEPDLELGNDEFGLNILGVDTCHNGSDDDGDGTCDEGGCLADDGVTWLVPDPSCARHSYKTSFCGSDNLCYTTGGERSSDGHLAELVCTATDDGEFVASADLVDELVSEVGEEAIAGAVLKVVRTSEELIQVPMVRDQIGNADNINPVRLRASQMQFGRLEWE